MPAVLFQVFEAVATITINRPQVRNALDPEAVVLLADAWKRVQDDDSIRVAVLTGAGDKAFCSGADLGKLIPLLTHARPPQDEWDRRLIEDKSLSSTAFLRGFSVYKPIIAAIRGHCLAGGFELALAADLRVASTDAQFALPEPHHGLIPAGGSLARLPRMVPYATAMEILLLGERFGAEDALRHGLLNRVVPPDKIMDTSMEIATSMSKLGPLALRKIKETVLKSWGLPLEQAFQIENESWRDIVRSEDAKEGARAFKEKRPPHYLGR